MNEPDQELEPLPCPECKYDLAGIPTGNCPECGRAFTPEQVREYWIAHKTRPRFPVDLAVSFAPAFLTFSCTFLQMGRSRFDLLSSSVVLGSSTLALLIAYEPARRGRLSPQRVILNMLPTAATAASVALQKAARLDCVVTFAVLLFQAVIVSITFRNSPVRSRSWFAYPLALFPPLLIAAHALVLLAIKGNTWTDFNWTSDQGIDRPTLAQNLLFQISMLLTGALLMIVSLEFVLFRLRAHSALTSSSAHSPAAESVPPSQSAP